MENPQVNTTAPAPIPSPNWGLRIGLSILGLTVAAVVACFAVYWWTYSGLGDKFSLSVLRSQVVSQQETSSVQAQLQELGYEFEPQDFFSLNDPNSSNYRANVLRAFEPEAVEEPLLRKGYYFYDKTGGAYFFETNESQEIDRDSFTPLLIH